MNKAQKRLTVNLISTIVIIVLFIFVFANFKDYTNKTETIRAFNQLGKKILDYRKQYGLIPSEASIEGIKEQMEGSVRTGKINYRAQWISIDSSPDSIVAYTEKQYSWFVKSGYVVLFLDGQVKYLSNEEFDKLLSKQQTAAEAEELKKAQKANQGF
jgi:hypothetical protein